MLSTTDDLRILEIKELSTPDEVMGEIPRTLTATRVVMAARNAIHAILNGADDRLLVIVGPCSIHDPAAAIDYATRLSALRGVRAKIAGALVNACSTRPRSRRTVRVAASTSAPANPSTESARVDITSIPSSSRIRSVTVIMPSAMPGIEFIALRHGFFYGPGT